MGLRAGGPRLAAVLWAMGMWLALTRPGSLWACACGCGVFDVQTSAMLPTRAGGMAFLEYDFMNQKQNWSGAAKASSDANSDKEILTHFMTAGAQYMFSPAWGIMGQIPFWSRHFSAADEGGNIADFDHAALGDMRVQAIYSGFSPNMSTGLTFGAKLPTGDYSYPHFDRDTEIGTGSTDFLLGAYHMGELTTDNRWVWFANGQWDEPALIMAGYRPGAEVDLVLGGYYNDWRVGGLKIAPLAQVIGNYRWRDSGAFGHWTDSGFKRLLLSPGFEFDARRLRVYAGVGFPVYQYVNGDQLVASEFYKFSVSYIF